MNYVDSLYSLERVGYLKINQWFAMIASLIVEFYSGIKGIDSMMEPVPKGK